MTEPVRKQMLTALGDLHRIAASAPANAELRDLARQHYMRSMDCAGEAGDLLREVFALDGLGPSDQPRPWKHFACNGDIGSGWRTAQQGIRLAKGMRSVSIRRSLAPLQEPAAARQDSVCQDLARQVAILRSAA
jgi:hypothetical protein